MKYSPLTFTWSFFPLLLEKTVASVPLKLITPLTCFITYHSVGAQSTWGYLYNKGDNMPGVTFLKEALSALSLSRPKTHKQFPKYQDVLLYLYMDLEDMVCWKQDLCRAECSILMHICPAATSLQKSACKRPQQCSHVHRHTIHANLAPRQEKDPKDLWRIATF